MQNPKLPDDLTPKGRRAVTRILDAAIEAIADRGAVGASLQDVAARAQVDKGVLRYYFGDRDGLMAAAIERLGERLIGDAESALASITDPDAGFDRGFEVLWSTVTSSPRLHGAYLELTAASIGDSELRRHVARVRDRYDRLVLDKAEQAIEDGYVWRLDPAAMSRLVIAALEGLAIDYLQRGESAELDSALRAYKDWLHSLSIPGPTAARGGRQRSTTPG